MSWTSKPYVARLKTYEPGRPIEEVERELGLKHLVKLASNENPLGVSARVARALKMFLPKLHYYPESTAPLLLEKLSRKLAVSRKQIIFGNGSNEIIEFLCRGLIAPGDEVLSSACSFLVYPILTQTCGGRYRTVPMKNFRYDLNALARAVTRRTKIIFIANPNNPTGTYVKKTELRVFLKKVPRRVLVCIDEAYFDFARARDYPNGLDFVKRGYENVLVLRTFSKSYGLAGLRIGYGAGPEKLIQYLHKVRQPFNVNAAAQVAALAALEDRAYLRRTQKTVWQGRDYLYKQLERLGFRYVPSEANFILIDLGEDAGDAIRQLLRKGLIVRAMHAYNLPSFIRVTIGRPSENAAFIRALASVHFKKKGR